MSNLRNRLKQIAQRPVEPIPAGAQCSIRENIHVAPQVVAQDALALMGGMGQKLLYLDTETTGLSRGAGTVAFMVGIGRLENDGLHVRQYYLTDYDQEEYMLRQLVEDIAACDTIVTYNGKSYDLPLLQNRLIMNRINPSVLSVPHVDLLHVARRVYKRRLQKCTLGDVEERILGIHRKEDLPGAEVPERWFRFMKTGDRSLLDDILTHNEQDIATLAHLLYDLGKAYTQPEQLGYDLDIFSVGMAMEKMGEPERAKCCYRMVESSESFFALARIYRRDGSTREAIRALEQSAALGGSGAVAAMEALAKLQEHRERDYAAALHWTDCALALCDASQIPALMHRRKRLSQKMRGVPG